MSISVGSTISVKFGPPSLSVSCLSEIKAIDMENNCVRICVTDAPSMLHLNILGSDLWVPMDRIIHTSDKNSFSPRTRETHISRHPLDTKFNTPETSPPPSRPRVTWTKLMPVEVYSPNDHNWSPGYVKEVISEQSVRITYTKTREFDYHSAFIRAPPTIQSTAQQELPNARPKIGKAMSEITFSRTKKPAIIQNHAVSAMIPFSESVEEPIEPQGEYTTVNATEVFSPTEFPIDERSPARTHPPIHAIGLADDEKEFETLAYKLWLATTSDAFQKHFVNDAEAFTGKDLVKYIHENVSKDKTSILASFGPARVATPNPADINPIRIGQVLLDRQYITCVFLEDSEYSPKMFENENDAFYTIDLEKSRKFESICKPDRNAWSVGKTIRVYSKRMDAWVNASITEMKDDLVTVEYTTGMHGDSKKRKVMDRFDENIESTKEFIEKQESLTTGSSVEVFSKGRGKWCEGKVVQVLPSDYTELSGRNHDILKVWYLGNEDGVAREWSKYVERWTPFVRAAGSGGFDSGDFQVTNSKWAKGGRVQVFSEKRGEWKDGIIVEMLASVKYGDRQKIVSLDSDSIKLVG